MAQVQRCSPLLAHVFQMSTHQPAEQTQRLRQPLAHGAAPEAPGAQKPGQTLVEGVRSWDPNQMEKLTI